MQVVDDAIARSFGLDLVRPGHTWAQDETILDRRGVQYALVAETSDAAMVVTRHEGLTETLRAAFYQCDGPNWHGFPVWQWESQVRRVVDSEGNPPQLH